MNKQLCIALLGLLCAHALTAETRSLLILHTNDFHGHITQESNYAGAARIAAYFTQIRSERDDVQVLDAGDMVSGTPVSTLFKGMPIFEVMSAMHYDAATLGNHEFDYGWRQILTFMKTADFPLLNANALDPAGKPLGDGAYRIIEINGILVGVIGSITEKTPYIIIPTGNEGLQFNLPADSIAPLLRRLRPVTDIIVLLAHIGHEQEVRLARRFPGIDLIVGGHSHTLVDPPVLIDHRSRKSWVVQANAYGTHVGRIELSVDIETDRVASLKGRLIVAKELPIPDSSVAALIAYWESMVMEQVDFQIAVSNRELADLELKRWMEQVLATIAQVDIGYYNKGGVRDRIYAGPVTARHVWNIEPFGNSLVTMRLKGRHLNHILKNNEDQRPALDDETVYEVATNNFIGEHTRRRLKSQVQIHDKGVLIRDILIEAIRQGQLPTEESEPQQPCSADRD